MSVPTPTEVKQPKISDKTKRTLKLVAIALTGVGVVYFVKRNVNAELDGKLDISLETDTDQS